MRPRNWDGATVDRSVLNRMRRLDRKLLVTFSPYALDPVTGNPIAGDGIDENDNILQGQPIPDPAFYLWRRHDIYGYVLVCIYPVSKGFGHLEVLKLESDLARFHTPADAWRIVYDKTERLRQSRIRHESSELRAKALDNKKLMLDAAAGDDGFFRRSGKGFSYAGQTSRTSGGERTVHKDARELGM
jgi:hypothetical protein